MDRSSLVRIAFAVLAMTLAEAARAVPANFQNEILITGITEPTGIVFTPDRRMLIIQRAGRISVVAAGAAQIDPAPFLQISNINTINGERGLIGIALDPNFATNNYYYVFYTANSPLNDRVSRFTANGNTTVAGSELVLWQDDNSSPNYHHGGALAFGADGNLYISTGMGDNSSPVQSLNSYRGKILRIRPDGTIPTDNPFYDGTGPNFDEIWARGLRNPYRFSIDSATGRMFIGDVGDNDPSTSIEEVNVGAAGANFGWPICQGNCNTPGMTNPIFSYPHGGRDSAITGGFVYRGTVFPAAYQGSYFYGDYVQNWIRRLTLDANGNVTGTANFEPMDGSSDGPYGDIVDLEQGPNGALYYVDIGLSWEGVIRQAAIRRIRYTSSNQPPSAQAWADVTLGPAPLTVNFSSAGSVDPENQPLTYSWTFGDGAVSNAANPSHTYLANGTYTVRLSVSDGVNSTFANNLTISVGTPPTVSITSPVDSSTFRVGDVITYAGSGTDSKGAAIPLSALSWNIQFLHDNHTHPFLGPLTNTAGGTFNIASTGHDYRGVTRYLVTLTATDSDGLQNISSVTIYPQKVNLTFAAAPTGLTVNVDGIAGVTPLLWDDIIGFQHTIDAPNQTQGSTQYNFVSWSDSGAQTHGIVVPSQDQTYTASFQVAPQPAGQMIAYGFSESTGSTTADSSGNARTATLTNATWTPSGRNGNGVAFNGTSGRVVGPSISLPSTFTMMAWINNPSNQAFETIMSVGQDRDLYLENGVLTFESPVPGTVRRFGAAISNNSWHHVAVVADATSARAYLDGNPLGTAQPVVTGAFTGVFQIGAWTNSSSTFDFFSGTMDDVRVYSVALTQAQVIADMNTSVGPAAPAPVPAIGTLSPSSVTAGGASFTLTVNGSNFVPASVVRWNGANRSTAFVSASQLTAAITAADIASAGSPSVTVFTPAPGGGTSNPQTLTIVAPNPLPATTSISPASALQGGAAFTLTVNGSNFINGSTVRWNANNRTTIFVNSGQLTAAITAADLVTAGPAAVTVFTAAPGGGTSNAQSFTITGTNPVPATLNISPTTIAAGSAGFTLTVNGSNFVNGATVRWNNSDRATTFVNAGQLTAAILQADVAAAGPAAVTVFNPAPGGGTSNSQSFTITVAGGGPLPGLVAAYSMNANGGTAIADSSGNGNNGTAANTTWTTSGRTGSALVFNGTSSMVTVLSSASLGLTGGMTLEAWIYPTVQPTGWRTIVAKEQPGSVLFFLHAGSSTANQPSTGMYVGGVERILTGGTRLAANTWTHLAATYDGVNQRLYVNGVQVSSRAQTGAMTPSASPLRIGGNTIWGEYFQGRIDDVRVYNRALLPAEITTDMNTPVTP